MDQELLERIDLIERMVLLGRRSTQYWGWNFVLWGAGQLVAMAWSKYSGRPGLAWGVIMTACGVLTGIIIARRKVSEQSESVVSRAIGAVWLCCGISISLLAFLGNPSGLFSERAFISVFFAIMGLTNETSGMILRWWPQMGMGIVWWAAAAFTIFGPAKLILWTFTGMVIVGEILFGLYLMAKEREARRHA